MSLARDLRKRRKLITVWVFLLMLVGGAKLDSWCKSTNAISCDKVGNSIVVNAPLIFAVVVLLTIAIKIFSYLWYKEEYSRPGFKNRPWEYDRKIIKLAGRVEKVLVDRTGERLKRHLTHAFRTITGNSDSANRYIHQRFLISSPQLRSGELLLVEHNVKFGNISGLKKGKWIHIEGEYLHTRGKRKGWFGKIKLSFYGRLHYTHEPKGSITVLSRKPAFNTSMDVVSADTSVEAQEKSSNIVSGKNLRAYA